MKKLITPIAVLALTLSVGASGAMIKTEGETVKVDARGLNLTSEEGQEVLYSRLRNAAKQVCGATSVHKAGSVKRAQNNRSCFDETLTRAVDSVGNEGLVAVHKTS